MADDIPGYDYDSQDLSEPPISDEEWEHLKQTVMWTDDDARALRKAGDILEPRTDEILDVWYGFVADHDHLLKYFSTEDGEPIERYLDQVKERFGQWIVDSCKRDYDEQWLRYQFEIARRHHRTKKNQTDDVDAVDIIHLRYLTAFIYPITATIRQFLAAEGHSDQEVDEMYHAWFKSVVLQATLWSYPYVKDGDF